MIILLKIYLGVGLLVAMTALTNPDVMGDEEVSGFERNIILIVTTIFISAIWPILVFKKQD